MARNLHVFIVLLAALILATASFTAVCTRVLYLLGVEMRRILFGEASDSFKVTTPFTFQPAE